MNTRFFRKAALIVALYFFVVGIISVAMANSLPGINRISLSPTGSDTSIAAISGQASDLGARFHSTNSQAITDATREKLRHVQLPFVRNQGQIANPSVHYYANTPDSMVWVTQDAIVYGFQRAGGSVEDNGSHKKMNGWILREIPKGFTPRTLPTGKDPARARISFFRGNPEHWRQEVPAFHGIFFGRVFDGIELSLGLSQGRVEKIFTVAPGADPHAILMTLEGADGLTVNPAGELEIQTGLGLVKMTAPLAFQEVDGKHVPVTVAYRLDPDQPTYGFAVGNYQKDLPLIIDPMLAATYIGSQCDDEITDLALDASGNVFVTGYSASSAYCENDFPVTSGAYQTTLKGANEVVVCKFSADLSTLLAATYLGSNGNDSGNAIAVDASGNIFVAGHAGGNDFPTTEGAYETAPQGADGFVSKFNNSLSSLLASTIFTTCNGYYYTNFHCMTLDGSGNVYVAGTSSWNWCDVFPPNAYDTDVDGSGDGIIVKFDNDLTTMLAGTALGGTGAADYINAIALDNAGNIFVAGQPRGVFFPTTPGAYMPEKPGTSAAVFISKLNPGMTDLLASTFYGGESSDYGTYVTDMLIDASKNVLITGETQSGNLPMTAYAYDTTFNGGWRDAYVARFNNNLSTLLAGTYLGAGDHDTANAVAQDSAGNVYVGGYTASTNFPVTVGADDTTHGYANYDNRYDAFVARFDSSLQSLSYSTFVGGAKNDYIYDILVDNSANIWITGTTYGDFPITQGAYDTTYHYLADGFVSKMTEPKYLAVDLKGPDSVIPGEEVTLTVFFHNGMDVKAEDVVVLVDASGDLEYVSSTDQGILCRSGSWAGNQLFWVLGDLDPAQNGKMAFTFRAPWGSTIGETSPFIASIGARNFPDTNFDLDFYLSYVPVSINNWSTVSDTGLTTLLSGDTGLKALYDYALSQGYFSSGKGAQANLSTGQMLKQVILFAPGTGDPTILSSIGGSIFAQVLKEARLIVFNEEGGFIWNADENVLEPWEASASSLPNALKPEDGIYRFMASSSGEKAVSPPKWCVFNCILKSVPEIVLKATNPFALATKIIYECGVAAHAVKEGKVTHETSVYMGQCALDIIGTFYGTAGSVAIDGATSLGICFGECIANPALHACPENDTKVFCCPPEIAHKVGRLHAVCGMECHFDGRWYGPEVIAVPPFGDSSLVCLDGVLLEKDQMDLFKKRGIKLKPFELREGGHDPNAKSAIPVGQVLPGQTIDYTVEYENVGQGTAYGVFIWDELDEDLDSSTLVINNGGTYINSLRLIAWQVGDLPPCTAQAPNVCKGQVTFSVKTKSDLSDGTEIINQAEVHFPSADEITPTNATVHAVGLVTSTPQTVEVVSGKPVSITLSGHAPGGAAVTYALTNGPPFGTLSGAAPKYTYTSGPQFSGQDVFYFTANSGGKTSSPAKVTINVAPDPSDRTAPTVVETSPETGDLNVHAEPTPYSTDPNHYRPTITATFSEPMDADTIIGSTFKVSDLTGNVSYNAQSRQATFIPEGALANTTTYTAQITTGAKDLAGNSLVSAHVWTFTTDGTSKLINLSAKPAAGGTVSGAGTYNEGQSITVTATANSGWIFENWTENGLVVSINATFTFSAEENRTLTANFRQVQYVSKTAGCNGKTPCNTTIQSALNTAADGSLIMVGQGIFNESPAKNTAGKATISGGWNSTFTSQESGTTRMRAPLAPQGILILQEVVIIP